MLLQSGIHLDINKIQYNKTILQDDGITSIVDVEHPYYLYNMKLQKNYYDISSKEKLVDSMITDLQATIRELTQLKEQYKQEER